jgi:hypothetical protein
MRQLIDIAKGHKQRRATVGQLGSMITVPAANLRIAPENGGGQI